MITSLETISPRTLLKKKVLYAQYVVRREDGNLYTFTDADLHNLCVFDVIYMHKILNIYMERRSSYSISLRRLVEIMRAQVRYYSQKDFELAVRLVQRDLKISPPYSKPGWILRYHPNSILHNPTFGFVYLDKDEILRFYDPRESHKYSTETLEWIFKRTATEVERGHLRMSEVSRILEAIKIQINFREWIFNVYRTIKADMLYAVDDFPESVVE